MGDAILKQVISRYTRKGRFALGLMLLGFAGFGAAGVLGTLDYLLGDGGRLAPPQVLLMGGSSAMLLWFSVGLADNLMAAGSVYVKERRLVVRGILRHAIPLSDITGFRREAAPTAAFRDNVDLIVESAGGRATRIHSGYNQTSLDEIQSQIGTLRYR